MECKKELYCRDVWADLAVEDPLEEDDEARPPSKKCSLCTKLMDQLKSAAGEDPDEDAINSALRSACKALGKRVARVCKSLLKKYKDQISEALQNNEDSTEFCTNIKMCRGSSELSDFWN
uniref:Antimicrobial peptide NK-lysin-like n=1 Tax=Pelodiscus sinensis TaxID=13735 RepID=K7FI17_PELSI|nr:antimicrobial peptide NK-lysin-like [Pelodiscus sinensis]|eukprot:XP_014430474.1 antimicrobial peptide NK-lysin-like [Pelodiscus sinensis]